MEASKKNRHWKLGLLWVGDKFPPMIKKIKEETRLPGSTITTRIAELYNHDPAFKMHILNALPKKKKASIIDFIPFLLLFITLVFVAVSLIPAVNNLFTERSFSEQVNLTAAGNTSRTAWTGIRSRGFDSMLAIFFFTGHVIILALASLLRTNSVFMILNVFIILGLILVGALINNFAPQLITDIGVAANLPLVGMILSKLVWIEVAFGIMTVITLYITSRVGSE